MTAVTPRPQRPFPTALAVGLFVTLALAVWSIATLDVEWRQLGELTIDGRNMRFGVEFRAAAGVYAVFSAMARLGDWSLFPEALGEMWTSVSIAWLGTMLAGLAAIPLGLLAAENVVGRWWSFFMRQIFNVLRAIPELILVLMLLIVFGFNATTGVIALGIGSIGTLSKLCSEAIESIDSGPIEAVDAAGATRLQRLRWAVLPQSAPEIISFILYRFEINIRVSAILGFLGIGGIGGKLANSLRFNEWETAAPRLVVVVVVTILIDAVSGWVRRRILAGPKGVVDPDDQPAQLAAAPAVAEAMP